MHANPQMVRWIEAELMQLTGRRYQIDFDQLDAHSLKEVQRLCRDLRFERQAAANRARLQPWRRA